MVGRKFGEEVEMKGHRGGGARDPIVVIRFSRLRSAIMRLSSRVFDR